MLSSHCWKELRVYFTEALSSAKQNDNWTDREDSKGFYAEYHEN
jgi:hypothetical protein